MHRYDSFPENGPKVFLGEYASQGNTWYNAVTEAAYMIGLEKAPAVGMACYAPMLCNVNCVNWKPDMIFFDNHRAYGTPSYYVQKMFMLHQGDVLLPLKGLLTQQLPIISQPLSGPIVMKAGCSEFAVSNLRLTEAAMTKNLPDIVLTMGQEAAIGCTGGGDFTLEWDAIELRCEPSKGEYGNRGLRLQFGNSISDEAMAWSLGGWQNSDSIMNRLYGGKRTCLSQSEFSFLSGQRRHFLLKGTGRKVSAFIDGERKKIVNTNWGGVTEGNSFGTHEFLELCRQLGCAPYLSGNVGSGTVQEFSDWVEYCNMGGQSPMSEAR